MKIWLFSSGCKRNVPTDHKLFNQCSAQRPTSLCMIPAEYGDADYYFEQCQARFSESGIQNFSLFPIDIPYSSKQLKKALTSDIIYFSGGNTFHLLHALRHSSLKKQLIHFLAQGGILAGHSAGAIIFTPSITTASYPDHDRDDNYLGLKDFTALNFVPFDFFPHFTKDPRYDNALIHHSEVLDHPIYAVADGAAITVENGSLCFHGDIRGYLAGHRFNVSGRYTDLSP